MTTSQARCLFIVTEFFTVKS